MKPENIMRLPRILIKKRQGLGIHGGLLKAGFDNILVNLSEARRLG